MNNQQGVALFIVIIVLIVASSLAAAVMTQSRLGINSFSFTKDKLTGEQELLSGVESIIQNEDLIANVMALDKDSSMEMTADSFHTKAEITITGESYCKRSDSASSINIINCRFARIKFSQENNDSRVQGSSMTTGIEQPFLAANNN